jgi:hypothetical protein
MANSETQLGRARTSVDSCWSSRLLSLGGMVWTYSGLSARWRRSIGRQRRSARSCGLRSKGWGRSVACATPPELGSARPPFVKCTNPAQCLT